MVRPFLTNFILTALISTAASIAVLYGMSSAGLLYEWHGNRNNSPIEAETFGIALKVIAVSGIALSATYAICMQFPYRYVVILVFTLLYFLFPWAPALLLAVLGTSGRNPHNVENWATIPTTQIVIGLLVAELRRKRASTNLRIPIG